MGLVIQCLSNMTETQLDPEYYGHGVIYCLLSQHLGGKASEDQGHPLMRKEFKASLDYVKP